MPLNAGSSGERSIRCWRIAFHGYCSSCDLAALYTTPTSSTVSRCRDLCLKYSDVGCSQRPNVKPTRLEAWTTALRADIFKDGLIDSKRLDIIIGPDARNGKGAATGIMQHRSESLGVLSEILPAGSFIWVCMVTVSSAAFKYNQSVPFVSISACKADLGYPECCTALFIQQHGFFSHAWFA